MFELEDRIKLLEDENIAQRHLIQLNELRKQKEDEDIRGYHTRLIQELETEKKKLEEDIFQVELHRIIILHLLLVQNYQDQTRRSCYGHSGQSK